MVALWDELKARYPKALPLGHRDWQDVKPCPGRTAQAAELLAGSPLLVKRDGELVKNPLHQVVRDNQDAVRLFARELGLSPSARAGLHVQQGPRSSLLETVSVSLVGARGVEPPCPITRLVVPDYITEALRDVA